MSLGFQGLQHTHTVCKEAPDDICGTTLSRETWLDCFDSLILIGVDHKPLCGLSEQMACHIWRLIWRSGLNTVSGGDLRRFLATYQLVSRVAPRRRFARIRCCFAGEISVWTAGSEKVKNELAKWITMTWRRTYFCKLLARPYLTLQRPDAHILLVQLLLLESDPVHQIIDSSILRLQHQLTIKTTQRHRMVSALSTMSATWRSSRNAKLRTCIASLKSSKQRPYTHIFTVPWQALVSSCGLVM